MHMMSADFHHSLFKKFFQKHYQSVKLFRSSTGPTFCCPVGSDPDQDRHFVGPGLDSSCLQRISAEDKDNARMARAILMHLQMQCDIRLNNVINLQQYILRYTVANPTALLNVTFKLVYK